MIDEDFIRSQIGELRACLPEARALARSGHPERRAEGKAAVAEIKDGIRDLKRMIADAQR